MKELNITQYLIELAKESKTNPRPWEAFEYKPDVNEEWYQCGTRFYKTECTVYRRKPRTVTRTVTWPEPLKEVEYYGQEVWSFSTTGARSWVWRNGDDSQRLLKAGLLWATEAEAQAAHDALMGVGEEKDYKALYHELIYQVEQKHPDESRHETAKRLIQNSQRCVPCNPIGGKELQN
jgi:hypothetical protein